MRVRELLHFVKYKNDAKCKNFSVSFQYIQLYPLNSPQSYFS